MKTRITTLSVAAVVAVLLVWAAPAAGRQETGLPMFPGQPGVPLPEFKGATDAYAFVHWWLVNQEPLLDLRRTVTGTSGSADPGAGFRRVLESDLDRVLEALEAAQGDSSSTVRAAAALALGKSRERRAISALLREPKDGMQAPLFDSSFEVRRSAILALGIGGDRAALDTLCEIVADSKWEPELRTVAAIAIGLIEVAPETPGEAEPQPAKSVPVVEWVETATVAVASAPSSPMAPTVSITAIACEPSGERAVLGFADGRLALWPFKLGKLGKEWKVHAGPVTALVYSGDGERLASAGVDGTVRIHQQKTGKEVVRFDGLGDVRCLALDAKGERLLAGNAAGEVILLPASGKKEFIERRAAHKAAVTGVAFSSWRGAAFSVAEDGLFILHETRAGVPSRVFASLGVPLVCLAVGGEGRFGVIATGDATVLGFALEGDEGKTLWTLDVPSAAVSLAVDALGRHFAVASAKGGVTGFEVETGAKTFTIETPCVRLAFATGKDGGALVASLDASLDRGGGCAAARFEPSSSSSPSPPSPPAPRGALGPPKAAAVDSEAAARRATALARLLDEAAFVKLEPLLQSGVAVGAALTADERLAAPLAQLLDRGPRAGVSAPVLGYLALAYGRVSQSTLTTSKALELLSQLAFKDAIATVRRNAVTALGRALEGQGGVSDADAVAQAMITRVQSSSGEADRSIENAIYLALGRIGGERAARFLREELRGSAGTSTGIVGQPLPKAGLDELDAAPFQSAALALMKDAGGYRMIAKRLEKEGAIHFRSALAISLGLFGVGQNAANRELESELKKERNPVLAASVALAIGLARAIDAGDTLRAKLLDPKSDATILPQLAVGLAMLESPPARKVPQLLAERLKAARQGPDRAALAFSLGLVGDTSSVDPLLDLLRDARALPDVRAAAVAALGELLDPGRFRRLGEALEVLDGVDDARIIALLAG